MVMSGPLTRTRKGIDRLVVFDVVASRYFSCGVFMGEAEIFPFIIAVENGSVGEAGGVESGASLLFRAKHKMGPEGCFVDAEVCPESPLGDPALPGAVSRDCGAEH